MTDARPAVDPSSLSSDLICLRLVDDHSHRTVLFVQWELIA